MDIAYKELAAKVLNKLGIKYDYIIGCRFIVSTRTSDLYFRIAYEGEASKDSSFYIDEDGIFIIKIKVDTYTTK